MSDCEFIKDLVGPCGDRAIGVSFGKHYCEKHLGLKCYDHKAQATHDCGNASALVCGRPLCDECGQECSSHYKEYLKSSILFYEKALVKHDEKRKELVKELESARANCLEGSSDE